MTLPSSGPLTLADIQTEFGGANPISLSEYYAGGTYVPAGTSGTYGAVPSSGTISIRNFYGTTAVVISITDQYVYDFTGGARSATAGYRLTSGGLAQTLVNTTFTTAETWCTPTAQAVNYEVYITVTAGTLSSGTSGSWVALSTTQTWTRTASIGANNLCTFTAQIRRVGTATVLDTATITLEADATF
jgi:hypothetical protein